MKPLKLFYIIVVPIILSAFLLPNCSCQQSLPVTSLLVDRWESNADFELSRGDIRAISQKVLSRQKWVAVKLDGSSKGVLRIRFQFVPDVKENKVGILMVNLKYSRKIRDDLQQFFGSASVDVLKSSDNHKNFERALNEGLSDLIASWQGENQRSSQLLERVRHYLSGDFVSESQLLQDIHLLGVKKEKKAVPLLTKILLGRNERAALSSLAALTNIGDSDAIDAITQFAERKNADIRKRAILAARQIGGAKAAAWLFTLSTGHEDPEVRLAASEALKSVERSGDKK